MLCLSRWLVGLGEGVAPSAATALLVRGLAPPLLLPCNMQAAAMLALQCAPPGTPQLFVQADAARARPPALAG